MKLMNYSSNSKQIPLHEATKSSASSPDPLFIRRDYRDGPCIRNESGVRVSKLFTVDRSIQRRFLWVHNPQEAVPPRRVSPSGGSFVWQGNNGIGRRVMNERGEAAFTEHCAKTAGLGRTLACDIALEATDSYALDGDSWNT